MLQGLTRRGISCSHLSQPRPDAVGLRLYRGRLQICRLDLCPLAFSTTLTRHPFSRPRPEQKSHYLPTDWFTAKDTQMQRGNFHSGSPYYLLTALFTRSLLWHPGSIGNKTGQTVLLAPLPWPLVARLQYPRSCLVALFGCPQCDDPVATILSALLPPDLVLSVSCLPLKLLKFDTEIG